MDLIFYHKSCPDGWTAAYIAKLKYPEAELIGRDHGLEPPYDLVKDKDVLVVDFSWRTREQNDKLYSLAKSFQIFDHHKSAQEILADVSYVIFDMKRSGAGLTWDYLFGRNGPGRSDWGPDTLWNRPWFVDYVEDRDLWNHALPKTKQINAYIMTLPMTVEAWDGLSKISKDRAAELGTGALAHVEHYVREVVRHAQPGMLNLHGNHYTVSVVNAPYLNISEVGAELAKTSDIGLGWFERVDGITQFSMRSEGDIDVSEVAKLFGGGGHKHAAGFQLSLDKGRELVDTVLDRTRKEAK